MAQTKEKTCPITRLQYEAFEASECQPILVKIADELAMTKRSFASGSFGFGANGKVTVKIDGVPVKVQVTVNATIVHSAHAEDA